MTREEALNPEKLYALAKDRSIEGRRELGQTISYLLEDRLTEEQRELAGQILFALTKKAETELREVLSTYLSIEEFAPKELIEYLANDDELSVSMPVLKDSNVLTDEFLVDFCQSKTADHWRIIAQRKKLGARLASTLVNFGDVETTKAVVSNEGADIDDKTIAFLSNAAKYMEDIQQPLIKRPEVDMNTATQLYWYAGQKIRQDILDRFTIPPKQLDTIIERALNAQLHKKSANTEVNEDMNILASRLYENRKITPQLLMDTLKNKNKPFLCCLLSKLTGVQTEVIFALMTRRHTTGLAAIGRACRMMQTDFTKIFIMISQMETKSQTTNPKELNLALEKFQRMDVNKAHNILHEMSHVTPKAASNG